MSDETLNIFIRKLRHTQVSPTYGICASRSDVVVVRETSGKIPAQHLILKKERFKDVRYEKFREVNPDCVERFMLQSGFTSILCIFFYYPPSGGFFFFIEKREKYGIIEVRKRKSL